MKIQITNWNVKSTDRITLLVMMLGLPKQVSIMSGLVFMCVWNSITLIHTNVIKVKESKVTEVCRETKTFLAVVRWKVNTVCDHARQLESTHVVCAMFWSTCSFKRLILCFIFWCLGVFFDYFEVVCEYMAETSSACPGSRIWVDIGAEGAVLPQWREARIRLLLGKEEVKAWPNGSFVTAVQVIIGDNMFFSVVIQGAAATKQVLGGSDCALGKILH